MKHITQVLLAIILFCITTVSWAQPADQAMPYREFLQSLTSAERKLPTDLVAAARYAAGQPLPASLEARAAAQARSTAEADDLVYRIDGSGTKALVAALSDLGVTPKFV